MMPCLPLISISRKVSAKGKVAAARRPRSHTAVQISHEASISHLLSLRALYFHPDDSHRESVGGPDCINYVLRWYLLFINLYRHTTYTLSTMAPTESLLANTAGRDVASVLADVRTALEHIRSAASSQGELDADRARVLKATLRHVREVLAMYEQEDDNAAFTTDDSRLLRALSRHIPSFDTWHARLTTKERDAEQRAKEQLLERTEIERELHTTEHDVLGGDEAGARAVRDDMLQVQSDMGDIAAINEHLNTMLHAQSAGVDAVEENVEDGARQTDEGIEQLRAGVKYSYGATGSAVGLFSAVVVGGVAAVGGLALAPVVGVAAVGGLTGRYVGKKVAKRAVKNATMHVDAHLESSPVHETELK